jgi:NADPH-dependent 2,4-dienoyl-CoA reductase/sulfur reductase-like enzyme/ferredoxin
MQRRIQSHPILVPPSDEPVTFTFEGREIQGRRGEAVSSALYANGIQIFGHHHRDGGAQGIFCVNGQCSQCLVLADGRPVKACMTPVRPGLRVEPVSGAPALPPEDEPVPIRETDLVQVEVLVVGGGPAGICAAAELGRAGADVLVLDDKDELGGKLSLQTHAFFGSVRACHAGTRGIDLAEILAEDLPSLPNVQTWLNATAVGVYVDGVVGVWQRDRYHLVKPQVLLLAAGARERSLYFPGCDLPGVYGAGAFQTLVNRDLVRAADRLFIVGGGNVGLIAGYHALQAGIGVVGLVEGLPRVGGYKVHLDKLKRLGVPVWTSHTVLRAEGEQRLERVTVAEVNERFEPQPGTERTYEVDALLIAVGLAPVNELSHKARQYGLPTFLAGDAAEIAEASAAIFSGRIAGRKVAAHLGRGGVVPPAWHSTAELLRSRPGEQHEFDAVDPGLPVYPLIRCVEEIPCNPCTEVCPVDAISIADGTITSQPEFAGRCLGCGRCVAICPGLAINLVVQDYDPKRRKALLELPWEFDDAFLGQPGDTVQTVDMEGAPVGEGTVVAVRERDDQRQRRLLRLEVRWEDRLRVAGFTLPLAGGEALSAGVPRGTVAPGGDASEKPEDDPIVCRCERVRRSTIVRAIRSGVRDMNVLKAVARPSMGGCGGKTCSELVMRIFRDEGVDPAEVTPGTHRPLVAEVPAGVLAGVQEGTGAGEGGAEGGGPGGGPGGGSP